MLKYDCNTSKKASRTHRGHHYGSHAISTHDPTTPSPTSTPSSYSITPPFHTVVYSTLAFTPSLSTTSLVNTPPSCLWLFLNPISCNPLRHLPRVILLHLPNIRLVTPLLWRRIIGHKLSMMITHVYNSFFTFYTLFIKSDFEFYFVCQQVHQLHIHHEGHVGQYIE